MAAADYVDTTRVATTEDFGPGGNGTSGFLPADQAGPIFDAVEKTSVVQQLAQRVPMGPNGVEIPYWNGQVNASWTDEAQAKPFTKGGLAKKPMSVKKITSIFVDSAEVVRANPGGYIQLMQRKIAEAIALKFDAAALAGTNTPFSSYVGQTTKSQELYVAAPSGTDNVYLELNKALKQLVADGHKLNGFLLDDVFEPTLNGAVDTTGRPLFIESPIQDNAVQYRGGRLLGRPTYLSDHVAEGTTVGYAGDWSQLVWGQVGGISYDVSQEATLPVGNAGEMVSLWQNNLVAVRIEAEFAILCNDPEAFVKLSYDETSGE